MVTSVLPPNAAHVHVVQLRELHAFDPSFVPAVLPLHEAIQ